LAILPIYIMVSVVLRGVALAMRKKRFFET
jgi:hypothetical protein